MKHGPNALIDENLPGRGSRDHATRTTRGAALRYEKTLSNIQEVKARGGKVIAVATEGDDGSGQGGRPRHLGSARPTSCCCRFSRWCRCSCWRITSPCAAAATSISRATWPRASRSSSAAGRTHHIAVSHARQGPVRIHRRRRDWVRRQDVHDRPADASSASTPRLRW